LFIYVVLQADLRAIQSNLEYISRYIDPEEKFGEGYCYYTHLVSATTYLTSLSPETVIDGLRQKQEATRKAAGSLPSPPRDPPPHPGQIASQPLAIPKVTIT
jgi:3'-phosphoadenosine 5'-phosphosulfate sulfotransferase (PAPS reductase)/FAD synthetase